MKSEITITHIHLETHIVITEDCVQLLIVENPTEFYNMVSDLDRQFEGEEGLFVFSANGQILAPHKVGAIVVDPFHFDLNDKKIVNLLYKKLESFAFGDKVQLLNELNSKTISFLSELSCFLPFTLDYEEPQPSDFFKISGLKFAKTYESIEEKIICYINALIELKNCEFFVFVNLKSVLSDEKLHALYNHCRSEQVGLLLVESGKMHRELLPCERAVVITDDLCEILVNYQEI